MYYFSVDTDFDLESIKYFSSDAPCHTLHAIIISKGGHNGLRSKFPESK